jgi:Zn-dependent protease
MEIHVQPLAPWVATRTERLRTGRMMTFAVNRRDGSALELDESDPTLGRQLAAGRFLPDSPPPPASPSGSHVVRFLRTFDARWVGADRIFVLVHESVGRHFWRPSWLILQAALALLGVVGVLAAVCSGRTVQVQLTGWDVPAYLLLSLVAVTVHELGHGLVLSHHQLKVSSLGFRLHLGSPAFYVESVEAFLLPRRQRLIQAAAGVWAEWQVISLAAIALWALPPSSCTPILHRFVLLGAVTVVANLLPFAGLDGALLLADLVREPNLASEAYEAAKRFPRERRPGDAMLVLYAALNGAIATAMLISSLGLWLVMFGRPLRALAGRGPAGTILALTLAAVSLGPSLGYSLHRLRQVTLVDQLFFRVERRRRVSTTLRFASVAPFDRLDEQSLGVLAGQLVFRRVSRSVPLQENDFEGWLAVDRPVVLGDSHGRRPVGPGLHRIDRLGVTLEMNRHLACARVALLSRSSVEILGV